jgi:hypothetical protein
LVLGSSLIWPQRCQLLGSRLFRVAPKVRQVSEINRIFFWRRHILGWSQHFPTSTSWNPTKTRGNRGWEDRLSNTRLLKLSRIIWVVFAYRVLNKYGVSSTGPTETMLINTSARPSAHPPIRPSIRPYRSHPHRYLETGGFGYRAHAFGESR